METNRANEIGAGQSADLSARLPQSTLANASIARIEAARLALQSPVTGIAARIELSQAAPAESLGHVAQAQQSVVTGAPLPPTTRELATMATDVYTPGAAMPAGWGLASASQIDEIGLTETMLSSPVSEFQAEVYTREIAGQTSYVVAFRGTQSGADWRGNIQQGLGLPTDYYNRALEIGNRLTVPEGARITLTGHSLGGGLASSAALAAELDAATFNAAGLSDPTLARANEIAGADGRIDIPDISAFYVRGEILSVLQDGGDRMIGALLGGHTGARHLDMPEAVGNRIELDAVRPEGAKWYENHSINRHGMDYVNASLQHQ